MGALTISLDDDLEEVFRRVCTNKYGDKKGKLKLGATEAFSKWLLKEIPEYEKSDYYYDKHDQKHIEEIKRLVRD